MKHPILIEIGDTVVSGELITKCFLCDIATCRGACCEEGDSGAPLEEAELACIEKALPEVLPLLSRQARAVIAQQGIAYRDAEGDLVTSLVNQRACVFAVKEQGLWQCALEKAYRAGKTAFLKPISCHLYPVRVHKHTGFTAVEYHRWKICDCARKRGGIAQLPMYQFLKAPLIRRFGEAWYHELCAAAQALQSVQQK